jgi:hypothetical protein
LRALALVASHPLLEKSEAWNMRRPAFGRLGPQRDIPRGLKPDAVYAAFFGMTEQLDEKVAIENSSPMTICRG